MFNKAAKSDSTAAASWASSALWATPSSVCSFWNAAICMLSTEGSSPSSWDHDNFLLSEDGEEQMWKNVNVIFERQRIRWFYREDTVLEMWTSWNTLIVGILYIYSNTSSHSLLTNGFQASSRRLLLFPIGKFFFFCKFLFFRSSCSPLPELSLFCSVKFHFPYSVLEGTGYYRIVAHWLQMGWIS